jgi:hypothetical protein
MKNEMTGSKALLEALIHEGVNTITGIADAMMLLPEKNN